MGTNWKQAEGPFDDGAPWSWRDIPELDLTLCTSQSPQLEGCGGPVPGVHESVLAPFGLI